MIFRHSWKFTMPRKVNYGVNYEEDFDDYEDYGYDYDDGYDYAEENGEYPVLSRELVRFLCLRSWGSTILFHLPSSA